MSEKTAVRKEAPPKKLGGTGFEKRESTFNRKRTTTFSFPQGQRTNSRDPKRNDGVKGRIRRNRTRKDEKRDGPNNGGAGGTAGG